MSPLINPTKTLSGIIGLILATTIAFWPVQANLLSIRLFIYFFVLSLVAGGSFLTVKKSWGNLQHKKLIPYYLFLVINLISFCLYSLPYGLHFHPHPLKLSLCFIFFLILILFYSDKMVFQQILKTAIVITVCLTALLILLHAISFKAYFLTPYFSLDGFLTGFSQKNQLSFFLVLIFPFLFSWSASNKNNIVLWFGVIIISAGIIYTFSRMGLLLWGLTMGLLCCLGQNKKLYLRQTLILLSLASILAITFDFGPDSYLEIKKLGKQSMGYHVENVQWINPHSYRLIYIKKTLDGFLNKPIFGNGLASFGRLNPDKCDNDDLVCRELYAANQEIIRTPSTHNDYAQILFELGCTGFILFFYMIAETLIKLVKARKQIPNDLNWVLDAQLTAFIILITGLFFINAYETLPFWFIQAGAVALITSKYDMGEK